MTFRLESPYIEKIAADYRAGDITRFCNYINRDGFAPTQADFESLTEKFIYADPYNARLVLYLPFWCLESVGASFRNTLRFAFNQLLRQSDVRENFNRGDVFEMSARPEKLDRVIKVIHLTPWLLKNCIIDKSEFMALCEELQDEPEFCQSLADVLPFWLSKRFFSKRAMQILTKITQNFPREARAKPLFESKKRKEWLAEQEQFAKPSADVTSSVDATSSATIKLSAGAKHRLKTKALLGNFKQNLNPDDLEKAFKKYSAPILRLGGSKVKGYSRENSDVDIYSLELGKNPDIDPENTHIILDTVWASNIEVDLAKEQSRYAKAIIKKASEDENLRNLYLGKLENDLLQYRLMHKGFPYSFSYLSKATAKFESMDGASAFYDDRYREVAAQLFYKFVYLPPRKH